MTVRRAIPALAALALFAGLTALYLSGQRALYDHIIQLWGIRPYAQPFFDTRGLVSAIECLRQGVDAYVTNPCDPENRLYDYPPSWSLLTLLPVTQTWVEPIGIALGLAFVASLLLLPAARDRVGTVMVAAGAVSCTALFTVERANNDIVVFILSALAAALLWRSAALRLLGYCMVQIAGLLKYFPMILMAAAVRELPRRFFIVAALSSAAVVLFALLTWHDLLRALGNIPKGAYIGEMFGAVNLGGGLVELLALPPALVPVLRVIFTGLALLIGLRLGLRADTGAALARLDGRERSFLLVGALLITSCFFAAQSIDYRAVHMLLMLPSLIALRGHNAPQRLQLAALGTLALLWWDMLRIRIIWIGINAGDALEPVIRIGGAWLLRELLWWWLMTVLISLIVGLMRGAPMIEWARERFSRGPATKAVS